MKNLLAVLMVSIPMCLVAQDYSALGQAFSDGNASSLGGWLGPVVELTINGKTESLKKGECQTEIQAFFTNNSVDSFKKVHEGVSGGDVHYMIGELNTSNGSFRITTYLKKSGEKYKIQSLEIDQ